MASTYSNLGIELIGAGEQTGTWGTTTNTNLGILIDQAIGGYTTVACTTGTATQSDGSADAVVVSHTHVATVTDPTHSHSIPSGAQPAYGQPGGSAPGGATSTGSASTGITVSNAVPVGSVSGTNQNLQPYYALCYIMKS